MDASHYSRLVLTPEIESGWNSGTLALVESPPLSFEWSFGGSLASISFPE